MLDVRLPKNKQIVIPDSVLRSANISPDDELDVRYQDGVIMLVCSNKTSAKTSLLDFAGSTTGLYGNTTDERQAYLENERTSWEK